MRVSTVLHAEFMDEFLCKLFMKRLTRRAMTIDEFQLDFR